jgi:hypothetical protein
MDIRLNTQMVHPYHDKVFGSEELKKNYNLQEVINKIKVFAKDHSVCLFIGKQPHESLPIEKNVIWISGDIVVTKSIPEDRLHLWLNFVDSDQLKDFTQLFDKIIIDRETRKFMGQNSEKEDFISRFQFLLKPNSNSELLFEKELFGINFGDVEEKVFNHVHLICPRDEMEEDKVDWFIDVYQKNTPAEKQKKNYEEFKEKNKNLPEEDLRDAFIDSILDAQYNESDFFEKLREWSSQKTKEHLENKFLSVEIIEDKPFPYSNSKTSTAYFIARGIKETRI